MANLRKIKKDIDYLVDEVITDCYMYLYFNPNKNAEGVEKILSAAVNFRNDLYDKINATPEKNVKQYYKSVSKEFFEGIDALFNEVSNLSKEK
jgi:hypothetical protein